MYGRCTVLGATLRGVEAIPVDVEVAVSNGLPGFSIVGMGDASVQEARERVRAALRSSGFQMPSDKLVVNLAPSSLRKTGSGNPGASNAMVSMGWGAGVAVAAHDILKAVAAVLLARRFFPAAHVGELAGIACVLGHMFPVFFAFRGGKGFASYLGMLLALDWRAAAVLMVLCAVLTFLTDYIVVATFTTVFSAPLYAFWRFGLCSALILCMGTLPILWKHRENIRRLRDGTEIGLRRASRGEHRVK